MSNIGSASFVSLASSVARSIAASESAGPVKTSAAPQSPSAADSIQNAFAALLQANKSDGGPSAQPGPIQPFVPPQLPSGGLMGAIKEALGAFHEIAGVKQQSGMQTVAPGMQTAGSGMQTVLHDMQRIAEPDKQRVGLESDKQRLLSFDKQRVAEDGGAAAADPQAGSPAVQVLDDAHSLFRLLDQVAAGDQAIAQKPNQMLR